MHDVTCSVPGCSIGTILARGWCGTHYRRWHTHGDVQAHIPIAHHKSHDERLDEGVVKRDGCWGWNGTVSKWTGYGTIGNVGVHRLMYERHVGPIPDGYVVDHMCHNEAAARGECEGGVACLHRQCCNPAHLQVAGRGENPAMSPIVASGRKRCGVAGCGSGGELLPGYCKKHYRRYVKYGDPTHPEPWDDYPDVCSVDGCARPHASRGHCGAHAMRVRKYGDPMPEKPIQTNPRRVPLQEVAP